MLDIGPGQLVCSYLILSEDYYLMLRALVCARIGITSLADSISRYTALQRAHWHLGL